MPLTCSRLVHLDLDVYLSAILDLRIQETRNLLKATESEERQSHLTELKQLRDSLATESTGTESESPEKGDSELFDRLRGQSSSRKSPVDHPTLSTSEITSCPSPSRPTPREITNSSNKDRAKALKRQKRNARNRSKPSNIAKTRIHAIERARRNVEKLEVEIGSGETKLEESGLSSQNGWKGSTVKQRLNWQGTVSELPARAVFCDTSRSSTIAYSTDGHLCFARAGSPPEGFLDDFQDLAPSILEDEQLNSASVKVNARSPDNGRYWN